MTNFPHNGHWKRCPGTGTPDDGKGECPTCHRPTAIVRGKYAAHKPATETTT